MPVRAITLAVSKYPREPNWTVAEAQASRDKIAELLRQHGASVEDWSANPGRTALSEHFEAWAGRDAPDVDDDTSHILYWTGHGEDADGEFWLATADSRSPLPGHQPIPAAELFRHVNNEQRQRRADGSPAWTLLILDVCGSGVGSRRIWRAFQPEFPPRNVGVIGTTEEGAAYSGRFATLLEAVLSGFDNETGGIQLVELVRRIRERLGPNQAHEAFDRSAVLPLASTALRGIAGPVDIQAELKRLLAERPDGVVNHFYLKAQGAELNELAWHFKGRERERRKINRWLERSLGGLFVVTGVAGVGKSALLGMILASTDPDLMHHLDQLGYQVDGAGLAPRAVTFDAVLHLSGQDFGTTLTSLADALSLSATTDVDMFLRAVGGAVNTAGRLTILADALDESHDPFTIAGGLLRRLAAIPGVRVLVGSRRSLGEDPDRPEPTVQNLIAVLNPDAQQLLFLEPDDDAVTRYTAERLRANLPQHDPNLLEDVADRIGAAGQPFLFARLAVHEISRDPATFLGPDVNGPLDDLLSGGHARIFRHAVARLRRDHPRVEALLHALAYSYGNGFPRTDGIWAVAGSALYNSELDDTDVEAALHDAAPYILRDTEAGQAVYRLAHRTFTEHYQLDDTTGWPATPDHIRPPGRR